MRLFARPSLRKPVGRRRLDRRAILATALIAAAGFAPVCGRADPLARPVRLTPEDQADLRQISAYLNSITTMYARFHQVSSNGSSATGQMWMERPGRMRFEYDLPSPILLIADRFYVFYIDKKLMEMQKIGLQATPAWLLLREPITFEDLIVTGFARDPRGLHVTVVEKAHSDKGSLAMTFALQPIALRQWTIVDAQRRTTTVSLEDEQFGMALDPKLFVYEDPFAAGRRPNNNEN